MPEYEEIDEPEGWDRWRWDTIREDQGQMVVVSYSDGPRSGRGEMGPGCRYQRVQDLSARAGYWFGELRG